MPAWTDYTSKTTPADTDEVMIKDFSDSNKANKRMLFSGLWNWIVNKLTNAVIANLETSPQTIVGAINSLNSNIIHFEKIKTTVVNSGSESGRISMELPTEQRYGYLIYILVVGSLGKYYPVLINYSTGEGSAIFSVINSPSDYSTTLNGNVLTLGISSGGVWNVYARAYKMI